MSNFLQSTLGQNFTNLTSTLDFSEALSSFQFARSFIDAKAQVEGASSLSSAFLSKTEFQDISIPFHSGLELVKTNLLLSSLVASAVLLLWVVAARFFTGPVIDRGLTLFGLNSNSIVGEKVSLGA